MRLTSILVVFCMVLSFSPMEASAELKAGAAVVDVTPEQLPVLVNGGMISRSVDTVKAPVNARAIVLDDGRERLGIVVGDSCMMPRPLLDEAKAMAAERTEIRPDRMLISASHSHTAPASMGCPGNGRRRELRAVFEREACPNAGGRRGEPGTGQSGLGGAKRGGFHGAAAMDYPAR